jgi:hypothetical protein
VRNFYTGLYVAISRVSDEDRVFICFRQDMLGKHGNAFTNKLLCKKILVTGSKSYGIWVRGWGKGGWILQ